MKDFILLLVVIVLLAPSGFISATPVGEKYDFPLAEGMVAMQAANTDFSTANLPDDSVIPTPLCRCAGTGQESSGDGLVKFPCVCQPNCKCKKPNGQIAEAEKIDVYTMYYFTAEWCVPCRRIKLYDIPALVKSGWTVVEGDWVKGADIVVIDIDKNPAKFAELREPTMQLIPTFVVTKNGKAIARRVGYVEFKDLATWYNTSVTEDRAKK